MELVAHFTNNNLHHAYCVTNTPVEELFSVFKKQSINTQGNPNFWHKTFETFTIDDARALKEIAVQKAVAKDKKFFILETQFFTREAQNALLKVLEEPVSGTHFFILISSQDRLLPTLQSRLCILKGKSEPQTQDSFDVEKFLSISQKDRLAFIKSKTDKKAKDGEKFTKAEAISFLNSIEKLLYEKKNLISSGELQDLFQEIQKTRSYMQDQGASIKMLLEHIALVTPKLTL